MCGRYDKRAANERMPERSGRSLIEQYPHRSGEFAL